MKTIWQELGEKGDEAGFAREMARIIHDSSSPEEVKRRLVDELGFPPITDNTFQCEVVEEGHFGAKMKDGRFLRSAYRNYAGQACNPMDAGA